MAFEIQPIDLDLFTQLFTPQVGKDLEPYVDVSRNGKGDTDNLTWAIDRTRNACVIGVYLVGKSLGRRSYPLVWNKDSALITRVERHVYTVVYFSKGLAGKTVAVKKLVREALLAGGELLDGASHLDHWLSVPYAEFVDGLPARPDQTARRS